MSTRFATTCLFVCVAALLTFSTPASAQTGDWAFCASEGGTCAFSGAQDVRYGANGAYVYKKLVDGTACTNSVFGDIAPGVVKQCHVWVWATTTTTTDWTLCASEGGTCGFAGTQEVRYGANGSYFYKTLTGGTACTNGVFGDPIRGTVKQCHTRVASDWAFCAAEGGTCAFSGTQQVRYGANGSYFYKSVTNSTACTNSVFGDPVPNVVKRCEVAGTTPVISEWTFCAAEGGSCAFSGTQEVRYGANNSYFYKTLSGGTACTNSVFGDPTPGVAKRCDVSGTPTTTLAPATPAPSPAPSPAPAPAPAPATYGPRAAITCPAGAYDLWPGSNIPYLASFQPAGTTYCVRAGVHYVTSAITPKRGDTFVGEYGAVLDGSGWSTSDGTQAAFRAHSQDIDYVTIRNLVIRNMPQRGIHAYYLNSDYWTIEYTEIANSKDTGLVFPAGSIIRYNAIHHNGYAGYLGQAAHHSLLEGNEIAYNGGEQKVGETTNVTFRNNFVHHNARSGIWYDLYNTGALVEGNRVEDNALIGIFFEGSSDNTIRNNTIRRNEVGVMLSISKNMQITGNTLDSNFRGISYFLNCQSMAHSPSFDLANNAASDNTIIVGTRSGAWASVFSHAGCTATQAAPYLNGSKNLTFSRNTYSVPSVTEWYWFWDGTRYWSLWQSLGQDLNSTLSQ